MSSLRWRLGGSSLLVRPFLPLCERLTVPISPGFMSLLFPSLNFVSCLTISACLTPTDPVISAAIVGKRLGSSKCGQDKHRWNGSQVETTLISTCRLICDGSSPLSQRRMTDWLILSSASPSISRSRLQKGWQLENGSSSGGSVGFPASFRWSISS